MVLIQSRLYGNFSEKTLSNAWKYKTPVTNSVNEELNEPVITLAALLQVFSVSIKRECDKRLFRFHLFCVYSTYDIFRVAKFFQSRAFENSCSLLNYLQDLLTHHFDFNLSVIYIEVIAIIFYY